MPQHHFLLRPLAHPNGRPEVVMCTEAGIVALIPRRWEPRSDGPVWLGECRGVPWSDAHSALLFGHVGWNRRNVVVAKPHAGCMWLTIVEDP